MSTRCDLFSLLRGLMGKNASSLTKSATVASIYHDAPRLRSRCADRVLPQRVSGDSVHSGMPVRRRPAIARDLKMRVAHPGRLTMTQTASTDFPALESDPIEKLSIDTIRTLCMDA